MAAQSCGPAAGLARDMSYDFNSERLDLMAEFEAAPYGPHSSDLQALLLWMRSRFQRDGWSIICLEKGGRYALVRLPEGRFDAIPINEEHIYQSPMDAEIALFRLRWETVS